MFINYRISSLLLIAVSLLSFAVIESSAYGDDYRVALGDSLRVTVDEHPELGGTVAVASDGTIRLPVVNNVQVKGRTLDEVTNLLTTEYKKLLVSPVVFVALDSPRADRVYVFGAVKTQGIIPLSEANRVLEAIIRAGGLSVEPASARAEIIRSVNNEHIPISLTDVIAGKSNANLALTDGDVLNIETLPTITVFLTGKLDNPGLYQLPQGSKLSNVLTVAKGVNEQSEEASLIMTRNMQETTITLHELYEQINTKDILLQNGDIIRFDSISVDVTVMGEVKTPKSYQLLPGSSISDAITAAGGPSATASLGSVRLKRLGSEVETVDVVKNGKIVFVKDGDRIMVPASSSRVLVVGSVKSPGYYPMDEKHPFTVTEAIMQAQGVDDKASLKDVHIVRVVDGKPTRVRVNVSRVLSGLDLDADVRLINDDVVFVPKKSGLSFGEVLSTITSFTIMRNNLN